MSLPLSLAPRLDSGAAPQPLLPHRSPLAIRWTRDDCERFEQAGFLTQRYELVEGDILYMTHFLPHITSVVRLFAWLLQVFGQDFVISQAAIDVSPEDNPTSCPKPDGAVLATALPVLIKQNPRQNSQARNVRLVVEVADSTLEYDLSVKAGLYARAGIAEYWVLNVAERRLHVRRRPVHGAYQDRSDFNDTDTVACLAAPSAPVQVSMLLP